MELLHLPSHKTRVSVRGLKEITKGMMSSTCRYNDTVDTHHFIY